MIKFLNKNNIHEQQQELLTRLNDFGEVGVIAIAIIDRVTNCGGFPPNIFPAEGSGWFKELPRTICLDKDYITLMFGNESFARFFLNENNVAIIEILVARHNSDFDTVTSYQSWHKFELLPNTLVSDRLWMLLLQAPYVRAFKYEHRDFK